MKTMIVYSLFFWSVTGALAKEGQKKANEKEGVSMSSVSIRYMINDVPAAIEFYTTHLGFTVGHVDSENKPPEFAAVIRDGVKLNLSGKKSSGRRTLPDGTVPVPGGWNRIMIEVKDIESEAKRLRSEGVKFRREDIVSGPGGSQIIVEDPDGNLVELFQSKKRY